MLYTFKSRSGSKPSWHRRRISKSATTIDGAFDPDLALAIQESLKQADIDALREKEKQTNTLSEMECGAFKENRTKSNIGNAYELSVETNHLKDLVCVHMDLIHQQQDVICQKDKTIKSLKAENNALQCRLQRMERRMALLRQKEEMSYSSHIVQSPPPKPGTMSYTEPLLSPMEKHSHKKKTEASLSLLPKKFHLQDISKANISSETIKNKLHESQRKRKTNATEVSEGFKTNATEVSEGFKTNATEVSEGFSNNIETSNLYFVGCYEPVAEEVEVDSRPDILKGAQSQIDVEVPSFRIKSYSNLYVIEGTEDHEDETFIRRHQKPEIEEKRRKRWDNQRLREEKMFEKMREKEEQSNKYKKPEDPVESFYPMLDDITHIEVVDKVPVTVFGQLVPYTQAESFSLPWTPKKHTSHRTRQK